MPRDLRSVWALALWSCSGAEPEVEPSSCEDASWEAVAQPFLTTWCTPCHASTVPEADRRGAPLGMDFDTWEGAHFFAAAIARRSGDEAAPMPPGGGTTLTEQEQISRWAECGAPGPTTSSEPCAERIEFSGDATGAGEPCAAGANAITGSLRLQGPLASEGALDCLCEIDGDLQIQGSLSELALPRLRRVGGQLTADTASLRALQLPELVQAGEIRLEGTSLEVLELDQLASVERLFLVAGGRLPSLFGPPRLTRVGSHFGLSNVAGVQVIDLPRLEEVDGDLIVEDLPALTRIVHTSDLESIGGSLRILDNPDLEAIEDFGLLSNIHGDLELGGGGARFLDALWAVKRIDGHLIVRDAPNLGRIVAFSDLEHVGGHLRVLRTAVVSVEGFDKLEDLGGLEIADNPNLESWDGGKPVQIAGPVRLANDPLLPALPMLRRVEVVQGEMEIVDLPALLSLGRMASLTELDGSLIIARNAALSDLGNTALQTIHGDLVLEDQPSLASLTGLSELTAVDGDLVLRQLPGLPAEQVEQLQQTVTVGGSTVIEP